MVVAIAAVSAVQSLRAQVRAVDYNFFDSRAGLETSTAPELPVDVTLVRHPFGRGIGQMYRLGGVLTPPAAGDAETIARSFLQEQRDLLALSGTTFVSLPLERRFESPAAGLTHLVFQQQYAGILVFGGEVLVHVTRDGSVLQVQSGADWSAPASPPVTPSACLVFSL